MSTIAQEFCLLPGLQSVTATCTQTMPMIFSASNVIIVVRFKDVEGTGGYCPI